MKKIFLGMIIGFIISFATSTYASSIIGKMVDGTFPLKINGKRAEKDVIVIEGTSYLPVRVSGELFGYDVDWINNEVILTSKKTNSDPTQEQVNKIIDNANEYPVKTNIQDLWVNQTPIQWIELNGDTYFHPMLFAKYVNWENPYLVFNFPNKQKIKVKIEEKYSLGVSGFSHNGRSYFKLSELGLKATLKDNVIWIEKI